VAILIAPGRCGFDQNVERNKLVTSITVRPELLLERILSMEIVRVAERAAVSAALLRGRGQKNAADQAAVDAMRRELNRLPIDGTVVIGEGELDEAPMLFIGEKVGNRNGPMVDIAVDPLEGTNLCANDAPGSIATLALAEAGTLLHAPDCYMEKIAIGPGYPQGTIDLDASPEDNIYSLAKAKGVRTSEITAILLDRPRHYDMINAVRKTGASVSLISDGDVAGVIHCAEPRAGIDIYLGSGGAPEGVLAAAALRCIGGQMQARLVIDSDALRERTTKMGIKDANKKLEIKDMVRGDCLFAATGVTTGAMLSGVNFGRLIETDTIVMRSATGTVRRVHGEHRDFSKFHLDE
jgi:fructose-1,6-bisphosphatase II / sedoheptulose-1,7-bisphosphatase